MYRNNYENDSSEFAFVGNYRGIVVNNQDPMEAGRCQIRIFSVYDNIPDEMLPWAHYADPMMQGIAGSGGFIIPDNGMRVWCFFETGDHMQPVYFAGAPSLVDGPANKTQNTDDVPRYGVAYTKNRVIRSPAGHLIEMDDTPGDSRMRVRHKSGSQTIYYENGDVHEEVVGNFKRTISGNFEEYVDGDSLRMVTGEQTVVITGNNEEYYQADSKESVTGDHTSNIGGNHQQLINGTSLHSSVGASDIRTDADLKLHAGGTAKLEATAATDVNGGVVNINSSAPAPIPAVAATDFTPSDTFQNTPVNAAVLIDVAGPKAAWDDEDETIPPGWPAEETQAEVAKPTEINVEANPQAPVSPDCELITTVNYSYQLSPSFTLHQLSRGAVFPHTIRAQGGLSESDIICNLKHLCINILEPLKQKFPNIRINSGFRAGGGTSQHNKGQAVDIQVPGASPKVYSDMAAWIAKNLPFDQFILEHGRSVWLHLSFNPSLGESQRGVKLTYWPSGSPQYKPGLKNYYDNGRVIT